MKNDQTNQQECGGCGKRRPTRRALVGLRVTCRLISQKNGEGRHCRENVAGKFGLGSGEEDDRKQRPGDEEKKRCVRSVAILPITQRADFDGSQERCPRKKSNQDDRHVKPERLDMLEFGSEEAFEVVLDDENAKEFGVAAGTEQVPGKRGEAKAGEYDGMKAAEGVAPAFCENSPKKKSAARENDRGRTFRKNGEAKEVSEENKSEPRSARNDRRILVASEADD